MPITAASTALELFHHFRPRYEEVELLPLNLVVNHWEYAHKTANDFYFRIGRNGTAISTVFLPSMNLIEAGVKFEFPFDGTKNPAPVSLWNDLNRTIAEAISAQLLKGRRFTLRPQNPDRAFDHSNGTGVVLEVDGPPIKGLDLTLKNKTLTWELFIPRESPEGQAIHARLRLAEQELVLNKVPRDQRAIIARARSSVEAALSQVSI